MGFVASFFVNPRFALPTTRKPTVVHGVAASATVLVVVVVTSLSYRRAIRKRLQQISDESFLWGGLSMKRIKNNNKNEAASTHNDIRQIKKRFHLFQLNPAFVKKHAGTWKFQSLGDYLDSLRPSVIPPFVSDLTAFVNHELEAALSTALLRVLGPIVGQAVLLPALGWGPVPSLVKRVSTSMAGRFLAYQQSHDNDTVNKKDAALLPVSIMGVWALSETQLAKHVTKANDATPLEKMKRGEYMTTGPSFATATFLDNKQEYLVSNSRFVMATDWDRALQGMEEHLMRKKKKEAGFSLVPGEQEANVRRDLKSAAYEEEEEQVHEPYTPNGRSLGTPVPLNPRLLPDLYMGWGDALCTHTHRQVLRNRLLSTLLNRLAANYYHVDYRKEDDSLFEVILDGKDGSEEIVVTSPDQLVRGLQELGHEVHMQITSHTTTFGLALCIKEEDGGWTNVPMATFLGSGYEYHDGQPAPALMPHGGLNMEISGEGPLFSRTDDRISIQHFMGFEGFAGWQSNHNADVPWIHDVTCGPPIADIAYGARLAALYAATLNAVASDLELPLGGYGLVGVCNDSAAVLESAMYGKTTIYPLTAVGKYSSHAIRYAKRYQEIFASLGDKRKAEIDALEQIIRAVRTLPTDIHASPGNLADATSRMLHCMPSDPSPFQLMVDAKALIRKIREEDNLPVEG